MKTHGSLFSGIGGFDLAAEWMGWENIFHCEKEKFPAQILKYYWPKAISYEDITKTDFTIHRGTIDILTGGFPCQPYSTSGKRLGTKDDRHLWPEMLRAIREIQPRWVLGENVRGLTNWNGGLVFDEVQTNLEAAGYEVLPFLLPACGVNAPHRRDRIWFIAHVSSQQRTLSVQQRGQNKTENINSDRKDESGIITDTAGIRRWPDSKSGLDVSRQLLQNGSEQESADKFVCISEGWDASNSESVGSQGRRIVEEIGRKGPRRIEQLDRLYQRTSWKDFPTQSPVCSGDDGFSDRLDFAAVFESVKYPRQPARAFGKWRNESIKAFGNAVVPELVLQIFKAIE